MAGVSQRKTACANNSKRTPPGHLKIIPNCWNRVFADPYKNMAEVNTRPNKKRRVFLSNRYNCED